MDDPHTTTRRRLLAGAAGASLTGLAGCTGGTTSGSAVESLPRPVRGDPDAGVTVAVFADFACPHCRTFATDVLPDLESAYLDDGVVRYEHWDFPIPVADRWSWRAAGAARAVQDTVGTDAFFAFVDSLFSAGWSNGRAQYTDGLLRQFAEQAGGDPDEVLRAADEERYRPVVERDRETGIERGAEGTPAVFVDGTLLDGYDYDTVAAAVERAR
ncbi:DsbA family protein [Halobaculum lipolyticum]|uniref:DsbA family protein n=1 Tax=Halobaculum lipolyticum TaxID=3032001 RepID=A0ABD5WF03_9EURY|nr:thioredoxin domain-containing protein [Halobaculum sp. DT31]